MNVYEAFIAELDAQQESLMKEAVEAAAKAIHEVVEAQFVKPASRLKWSNPLIARDDYRDQARAALVAAAAVLGGVTL